MRENTRPLHTNHIPKNFFQRVYYTHADFCFTNHLVIY